MSDKAKSDAGDARRGYSKADLDEVADSPELTAEDLAKARPFAEVFPDLALSARRVRGKQKSPTKLLVSLRLDRSVVEAFRADGPGWQGRMNAALKEAVRRR